MTDSMDEKTQEAFEGAGFLDPETKARFAEERKATLAMITELEAKYVDRGLKFTIPFHGACPVQAYGHLDGVRFYFRFRSNTGSLKLGPFDQEIEDLTYERNLEQAQIHRNRDDARLAAGEITETDYKFFTALRSPEVKAEESDKDFYPTRITKSSWTEGPIPDDDYNGYLNNEEARVMFSTLIDTLEDIPEEEQLDTFTRIYLYEGIAASQAYWEERRNKAAKE